MKYFLIEADPASLEIQRTEYSNASDALQARLNREIQVRGTGVEVVVVGSPSLDDLKVTHSRYFRAEELPDIPGACKQDQEIARLHQMSAELAQASQGS